MEAIKEGRLVLRTDLDQECDDGIFTITFDDEEYGIELGIQAGSVCATRPGMLRPDPIATARPCSIYHGGDHIFDGEIIDGALHLDDEDLEDLDALVVEALALAASLPSDVLPEAS